MRNKTILWICFFFVIRFEPKPLLNVGPRNSVDRCLMSGSTNHGHGMKMRNGKKIKKNNPTRNIQYSMSDRWNQIKLINYCCISKFVCFFMRPTKFVFFLVFNPNELRIEKD